MKLIFDWDRVKENSNRKKHGVSFEEAKTVFFDENAIEFYDESHSQNEDRFLLLGFSSQLRLLLVCHCYRKESQKGVIRIISARKATKQEQKEYWRE